MKRFFILLVITCMSITKIAAQNIPTYYDDYGNAWEYEGSTINTVKFKNEDSPQFDSIPSEIYGYTITSLGPVFKDKNIYGTIKLPKTVTSLHATFQNCGISRVENTEQLTEVYGAFSECWNLDSINLPNVTILGEGNTSTSAYNGTFEKCNNLRFVNIPNVTKLEAHTFAGCTSLQSIDMPKVTEIDYNAFYDCTSLQHIDISNVTRIESAVFYGCTSLQSIKCQNITEIGSSAFYQCTNLQSIECPNITEIGYAAFYQCTSLQSIECPNITSIEACTFNGCTSLQRIDCPNVTTIKGNDNLYGSGGGAFAGCTNLENVSINFSNVTEIGSYAFTKCQFTQKYTDLDLANCKTVGRHVFDGFINLKNITLSNQIISIGEDAFGTIEKVTIGATNVPTFGGGLNFQTSIFVPKEVLNDYKSANIWKDYAGQILAIGEKTDYDVTTTALDNAPGLLQQLDRDKLNNIVSLKVSGTINGYDIMLFRNKMDNLHHLDLSDVDIVANPYEYYEGYCTQDSILGNNAFSNLTKLITVKCPNSVKYIYGAFNNCGNLKAVVLPEHLYYIGDNTDYHGSILDNGPFTNCGQLTDVIFKNCKEIGTNTFKQCKSLSKIDLPNGLTRIGIYAFKGCRRLEDIIIPNGVETIDDLAFEECGNLKKISFPPSLKDIGKYAFRSCSALDSISLPGLTRIEDEAFRYCKNLKELKVPSTLESIGENAFAGCCLEKVYTYTVLPVNISQSTFSNFENISLYVPTQSVDNYYLNTQWSQFKEIHEFDEPYTYFYLDKEFTLEKRFDGTPDIDIKEDGGLKVDGKDNQEAGDVTIKGDGDKGNSGTLITDGNLNAKKMRFDITVTANKWYFFSFPFDINFADVKAPGEYKWKRYDGSIRADQGSGGWVDLANNEEWLKQGDGYIFQTNKEGILTLRVTKEKFGQLDANNIMKPLDSYPSDNNIDASWNFIGNPQTSYFNVNDLGYEAPITVWNGSSYEAVRPGDDDYTLHPFQAFFVQKPTATSGIEFKAEDRLTKTGSQIRAQETKARRLAKGFTPSRMIINLSVTDGTQTDKTRVVFNDKKSRNYELDCDAAKFMTMTTAPQLYSVEGKDTKLAINERPMGSVQLGFTAKKAGTYTISAARMDQPMLLQDNQTGITFDLTNGDYEFSSGAGIFDSRFMLMPSKGTTGIADIIKQTGVNIMPTDEGLYINGSNGNNVMVYNLNGMEVANRNTDGMLNLTTGVYIVKVNGVSTKVMVK